MQILLLEYLNLFSLCIGVYTFYSAGVKLTKYFIKFVKKFKFFQKLDKDPYQESLFSSNYVLVRGRAFKIFSRDSEEINSSIIISESNSTYSEDFFLLTNKNKEKFYIQPDIKTKLYDLNFQYLGQEIENKFLNFFNKIILRKSQVLKDEDFIFVFGKFQYGSDKNSSNYIKVMNEFKHLISIRPKEILGSSYNVLMNKVMWDQIGKIMFHSLKFFLCGFLKKFFLLSKEGKESNV